jgi:hypothetical protein
MQEVNKPSYLKLDNQVGDINSLNAYNMNYDAIAANADVLYINRFIAAMLNSDPLTDVSELFKMLPDVMLTELSLMFEDYRKEPRSLHLKDLFMFSLLMASSEIGTVYEKDISDYVTGSFIAVCSERMKRMGLVEIDYNNFSVVSKREYATATEAGKNLMKGV